ncbi:MAG TPA: hypothetical protein VFR68_06330 [Candidatus Dormibacteraeota bacterium]|nr:hypothetical protein [Candidatus Dormibacteraeota bacterium]
MTLKGNLIPSTVGGPSAGYTVEVIRDKTPPHVELYYSGRPGDRPAAWDDVLDLEHY